MYRPIPNSTPSSEHHHLSNDKSGSGNTGGHLVTIHHPAHSADHRNFPIEPSSAPFGSTCRYLHHSIMNLINPQHRQRSILKLLGSIILSATLFFLSFHSGPTSALPAFLSLQQPPNSDLPAIYTSYQTIQVDLTLHSNHSSSSIAVALPSTTPDSYDPHPNEADRRILDAAPILGFYDQSNGELADWMASIPDDILITRMNIPGTHDSATWNYTHETQKALEPITGRLPPSIAFQCQLGTLGESRGKLIFIQRIDWEYIRNNPSLKPIGIPLPPSKFKVNDPSFTITYGSEDGSNQPSKVFVEDYFNLLPNPTTVQRKVDMKFNAVVKHLDLATSADDSHGQNGDSDLRNSLFITFTSGGALTNILPVTPKRLAIGSGRGKSLSNSVNGKFLSLIQDRYQNRNDPERPGSVRLGVVIFDWYHQLPSLIHDFIKLNPSHL